MPLQGSTKNACPLLLVISILALLVAIRPLLLRGRARLRCSVASVLLPLSLLVAGVLRGSSLGWPVALLLAWVSLLVGVLLLVPCLLRGRALLVPRLLLAVLGVSPLVVVLRGLLEGAVVGLLRVGLLVGVLAMSIRVVLLAQRL